MVPHLRKQFNSTFTEKRYQQLLRTLDDRCGMHVEFRVSETPVFLPRNLVETMVTAGEEIIQQVISNATYLTESDRSIPHAYLVPNEPPHPMFVAVDFGITKSTDGLYTPMLIEMQGFPSLFAFQPTLSELYRQVYGLPNDLQWFLSGLSTEEYAKAFRTAVLSYHAPENVVLLELDPEKQKTRPDFLLTEKLCGIRTVNIREIVIQGSHMFYRHAGQLIPIYRVYNRAIADELERVDAELPFSFRDDIHVEWAGHPNWFFRLSKFSLPYVKHPHVPDSKFLSDVQTVPDDLDQWVLKPLFSFAGSGVKVGPTKADIDAIVGDNRLNFMLQRRIDYGSFVDTPHGGTKAEVRILYIWLDHLTAVSNLVRMGRGTMMGVGFNKDVPWVGSSAGLFPLAGE
ncbi:MAG TPA: hypothetical protein VGB89_06465 [Bacteroidota bacterium]